MHIKRPAEPNRRGVEVVPSVVLVTLSTEERKREGATVVGSVRLAVLLMLPERPALDQELLAASPRHVPQSVAMPTAVATSLDGSIIAPVRTGAPLPARNSLRNEKNRGTLFQLR